MSPETIPIRLGHAPMGRYSLTYEINGSEKATKAAVSIYLLGVGEVQWFDVDVQPRAQIEFLLDASKFDLGPSVRFRAHCPSGDTDWFVMGSQPLGYPENVSSRQIVNVTPAYLQASPGSPGSGVPIEISGSQITQECIPEAQVDETTVELKNVVALNKQIRGLLMYSDMQGRPVVARQMEVKLLVYGKTGMPSESTFNLNLVE